MSANPFDTYDPALDPNLNPSASPAPQQTPPKRIMEKPPPGALHKAAFAPDDWPAVPKMLEAGADPNEVDAKGAA